MELPKLATKLESLKIAKIGIIWDLLIELPKLAIYVIAKIGYLWSCQNWLLSWKSENCQNWYNLGMSKVAKVGSVSYLCHGGNCVNE